MQRKKVAIVGGGITGLAATYYLQEKIKELHLPYDIVLIESSQKLGGKIKTMKKDGFVIEGGPDSFLARKMSASHLAEAVGLKEDLIANATGKSYVLVDETLHSIPQGSIMGVPTDMKAFFQSNLFSLQGKVRATADYVIPRSSDEEDQSLGKFFRRRLGDEVVENLIEPLLSGIYAGDIDQLSLLSTYPQFYEAERQHRSLIKGMRKTTPTLQSAQKISPKQKKGAFLTFKNGLQSFVEALEKHIDPGTILKGTRVMSTTKNENQYEMILNNGETKIVDSIILTVPHHALSSIFPHAGIFKEVEKVPSTTVATVAMTFPAEAVVHDIDGTGFVVSRNSDYTITACTWTHKKWPHSTPDGKVMLRCYVGKAGDESIVNLSDAEIVKIVMEDLNKIMDIKQDPDFSVVTRWERAMPQYTVGHKERLNQLEVNLTNQLPGVFISGSSFGGVGIPDCIDSGKNAVEKVLTYL